MILQDQKQFVQFRLKRKKSSDRSLMKNSNSKYWIVTFMALLMACKEGHEIKPATYSMILTGEESKSWEQASFTFIFNDEEVPDYDANLIYNIPDCSLDDVYTFIRDGKQVEVFEGDEKCDPDGDDLLFRTSWDIVNANPSIFIGGGEFILTKLTDDSLVYGFRDTLVAPVGESTFWEFPGVAQWVYKPIN